MRNAGGKEGIEQRETYGRDQAIALTLRLLNDRKPLEKDQIAPELLEDEAFQKLYATIMDIRDLSSALSRGELKHFVFNKGFILSGLKGLQSNLRHLTWQTQKIAEGDFSQKVDFLGEFSVSFNEMVDKLADMTEQLRRLASTDALTQVPNRQSLEQFFGAAFQKAREAQSPLSVLEMDIDHFKQVNDTYGHPVGDQVLIKVSEVLAAQFRSSDMFARFGGEEFLAVLPNTNLDKAMQIGGRTLKAIEETCIPVVDCADVESISVTVSIGASEICPEDHDYHQIIERADRALYEAKHMGRNRICSTMRGAACAGDGEDDAVIHE